MHKIKKKKPAAQRPLLAKAVKRNHKPEAGLQGLMDSRWAGQTSSPQGINHREKWRRTSEPEKESTDDLKVKPVWNYQTAPGHRDPEYLWSQNYPRDPGDPKESRDPGDSEGLWSSERPKRTRASRLADPTQLQRTRIWSPSSTA